jgi:hypothetical protein
MGFSPILVARSSPALRDQHIDLSQLRNDLFRCMPLPRH